MSTDEDPYAFILGGNQNQQKPKKSSTPVNRRLLGIVFVAVTSLIVVLVASAIISNLGDKGEDLISARAYQVEMERVIELGEDVTDVETRHRLSTLKLVLSTDQPRTASLVSSRGLKPTAQQIAQHKDTGLASDLEDAKITGNYNATFIEALEELAQDYYAALNVALGKATTTIERQTLTTAKENIEVVYP